MTLVITHGSFSCQATAARPLSPLGGGISETAQPYQREAPAAVVHPALSRATQKEMFQAKKHRTCLTHMPSRWVRGCQVIPTVDGHHRRILYLWRSGGNGIIPLGKGVRASSRAVISAVRIAPAGYKIMSQAGQDGRTPHARRMAQCRAGNFVGEPIAIGAAAVLILHLGRHREGGQLLNE